jgi:catechol 2,3-dioxygenase-like lactoylglutathione lyase family enzyme
MLLDHIILTVSDVERSLAFYEAALKPLHIKFFMPYKGEGGHPDLWGFGDGKRAFFWIKQGKPAHSTHRDQAVHAIVITGTTAS